MKEHVNLELLVGLFVIIGILCLGYLSIAVANAELWGVHGYDVSADFSDIGGIKVGSSVVIAGVEVGRVKSINLTNYEARLVLQIDHPGVQLHDDAIVSVKTSGLIGEKFVQISVGSADEIIKPNGRIRQTESAVDLEALISKYAFGSI